MVLLQQIPLSPGTHGKTCSLRIAGLAGSGEPLRPCFQSRGSIESVSIPWDVLYSYTGFYLCNGNYMCRLGEYSDYVQLQAPRELQPGCELCQENRAMLEAAYKVRQRCSCPWSRCPCHLALLWLCMQKKHGHGKYAKGFLFYVQTVAMYFFDISGRFSQARWAEQLLATLQVSCCPFLGNCALIL